MNITHDPSEYIRGIQQIIVSDKKRIGFLFGAGTSFVKKNEHSINIPAVQQMTSNILADLADAKKYPALATKYVQVFTDLKAEIPEGKFNVESILSNLEQKSQIIGQGKLNQLDKNELDKLISDFKSLIKVMVSVHKKVLSEKKQDAIIYTDFADWIGHASRKYPIEVFTTNYDFLLEIGLEHHNIPYYSGFSGSFQPFFTPETVEDINFLPHQTKVWKIHGSLGWHHEKETGKVIRRAPSDEDILIYPSTLKYNDSQKQPYTSLMDRLNLFLRQDDSILFVCGYSFNDEHINEKIISALKTNTTSHVIVFYFDKVKVTEKGKEPFFLLTEDSVISKIAKTNSKISVYGIRSGVIGRKFGNWKLRKEPSKDDTPIVNSYFDEDAPITDSVWTGNGNFILPDFCKFVSFLNSMIIRDEVSRLGKNEN